MGAIVWIGLGLTGHALSVWAHRNREWAFATKLQSAFAWIEPPAFVVGPLLLLVTGIWLVIDGPWGFRDTWIAIGLGGYAAALGLGVAFQGPGMRRLNAITGERGPDDPEAIALGRRLNGLMWPELAILTVVLLAMTTKPRGAGSVGFWATATAILAASAVLASRDFVAARAPGPDSPGG